MGDFAWINGRLVAEEDAAVSVRDHGFLYGDGVFETIRIYAGTPFELDRHLERMAAGLTALEFEEALSADALAAAVTLLCGRNAAGDGIVRITVTRGVGLGRMTIAAGTPATVAAVYDALDPEDLSRRAAAGAAAITVEDARSHWIGLKTLNYLPNVMAKRQAEKAGAQEAVFTDKDGFLLEGTVSNVFAVRRGQIMTPPADGRILPGVARDLVLKLALALGLEISETALPRNRVYAADEVFLTNSVYEIMPVVLLDGREISGGRPGPVAASLAAAYRNEVLEKTGEG